MKTYARIFIKSHPSPPPPVKNRRNLMLFLFSFHNAYNCSRQNYKGTGNWATCNKKKATTKTYRSKIKNNWHIRKKRLTYC